MFHFDAIAVIMPFVVGMVEDKITTHPNAFLTNLYAVWRILLRKLEYAYALVILVGQNLHTVQINDLTFVVMMIAIVLLKMIQLIENVDLAHSD